MTSNIIGFVPENDESDQPTIFGDLRKKLVDEFASEITEFSDNYERLKVFLRVRPFTPEETLAQKQSCLLIEDDHYVTALAPKESNSFKNNTHCGSKNIQKFKFSKIFREDDDQLQFYNGTVRSLVDDFLTGQNCLVFAYGVTNAGKTYTVQGNPKNPGVLPRTLETIFNYVNGKQWQGLDLKPKMFLDVVKLSPKSEHEERNKKDVLLRMASFDDSDCSSLLVDSGRESCPLEVTERSQESDVNDEELLHSTQLTETVGDQIKYSVWVSFAEVYNEQVFDLLEVPNLKKRTLLKLGEDKHGNPYIRGLTEMNVTSAEEALKLMTIGQKNLRKAATKLNHNSSRSHCIFNIKLLRVVNRENPCVAKVTMLSLCDLAGSERACKTNSTGDRLKEAGNINTSLLTLGRCIETMRSNQLRKDFLPRMIPYRDSKLTRLFQGFFSGRGKAVMIVNVNKCSSLFDETLQVFKFSAIAKQVVIQQKVEKPTSVTISPVLPVNPLSHMERASIPWADDVHEISRANYSNRLSTADETMSDEEITEREKGLLDIIDKCKKAITYLKETLAKEKKERMLDEIRLRDEITKELMEQFVAIEKTYSEKFHVNRLLAEEATDSKITKMLETLNPAKKRPHAEVEAEEEEMVPLHVLQESQNKIKECELQIQELTQRLESTKKQMRRMTSDNSKLACENTCLQFQVSDMLKIPVSQKATQCETLSDNLEQANVLTKLTTMLKSTQEKLKEKQDEASELEEQLQEAGETFYQNQQQIEDLKEMVANLQQSNKNPVECEACKARSENTWQLKPELKSQSDNDVYQKYLMDFEERERALINGYNAEITKYKTQLSQLRLQLVHTKSAASHLSPTKDPTAKGKENLSSQTQIKQYLLRHVRRLQDELDKNSQSVAEVHQALELKKAAEIDLEQRLAYETAGHRQAKVLISELKAKVKRLAERCRSASFEAEKTFAAIESELSIIENQPVTVKEQFSEHESFHSATENSFELAKGETDNNIASGTENQSVNLKVIKDKSGKQDRKTEKNISGNGSSFCLDRECLEQKIINKNMEIVRLQEKLMVHAKLERDLKDIACKNEKLTTQLKAMSGFEIEVKKKASIIRSLEEKLKNTEVLEVEIESQAHVIQHLQAAVNERSLLLAKLQNCSSQPTSPVSDRKIEEMETVIADLREMVDKSTKELSQKDAEIQALTDEGKHSVESLENEVQSLKTAANSLEAELQNLKKEKESSEILKKTLEKELERLKEENSSVSDSKNSLQKELENSNKKNKEIYNMKTTLEKNLEHLKLENKTINDLKNSLIKDLENIKAENETISNFKNTLEKDLEISKTENKTLLDLKNSLTKELESLKAENKLVSSRKDSLEKDLRYCEEEKKNISEVKNSLEKEIQILKEENRTLLEKDSLHSKLLSEFDTKDKVVNKQNNSLIFAKMAQKELEENLEAKKKELRAKDAELIKMSKLLEQKRATSEITVPCKKQDVKCQVTELPDGAEQRKETTNNLQSANLGVVNEQGSSLLQEPKMKNLEEIHILKRKLEDNLKAKEDLLIENSNLVLLLTEKDQKIAELNNGNGKDESTLKTLTPVTGDKKTTMAQLKADLDVEKQRCKELTMKLEMVNKQVDSLKSGENQKLIAIQMKLNTNVLSSQVEATETVEKKDSENHTKCDNSLSEMHIPQAETASYETDKVNTSVEEKSPNNHDQDVIMLQSELQQVQNLLDAERSINKKLQLELDATNEALDQLKRDYDNEKNISFNLKYELNDVKGSLSEVLNTFDPSNKPRKEDLIENNKDESMDEIIKKLIQNMAPENRKIVEDLNKGLKSWQAKYKESTMELISERQKLLDAQHSRSENFYLRQDNEKLQEKLSIVQKQLQDLESRQEIQQITLETDQMTKKLIEDRKRSEEQHLRDDLNHLRKELGAAQEKIKSYGELEAEVKQLRERIACQEVANKIKETPQEAAVSVNEVNQLKPNSEVRLDEKEKCEVMCREIVILSEELTAAQKETQYLRDKVDKKDKGNCLSSTPLLDTKVGSNRQLRREKIEAENAKMKAEFSLKMAQEEIQSLRKQLEKFIRKVSVDSVFKLDSVLAPKNYKDETLLLEDKMEENEAKNSPVNNQTLKKLQKEMQELLSNFKEEKAKVSKLEDDLNQKRCVIGILKESLQKEEELMIDFEKLLLQKDEKIKNLNIELNEEKKMRQEDKENLPRPSLEKEQLKTVVTNQTETIQVLSQRNTEQEFTCTTMQNELQNIKLSLSIVTAERDSLRKRLHLAETTAGSACSCNNDSRLCPQKSLDNVKNTKETLIKNTALSSSSDDDDKYWHQQKELVMESIRKMAGNRGQHENPSPKPLVGSPACETRRVKRSSGPHPETSSCTQKKVCLSPASDQTLQREASPSLPPPKEEYIEIDVTPPVAAKALKRNRKRKPLELPAQGNFLNSSKLSISSKSLSLCRRAKVSDEEPSSGQEIPKESSTRLSRHSKSVAMKRIQQSSRSLKETSPINKRKKSVEEVKTTDDHMPDSKGKNALSRLKSLTSSFHSPSFRGAKNLLGSPRIWSMRDTANKNIPGSPKTQWTSRTVKPSSPISKTNSADDLKRQQELHNILSVATSGPQRKRRLYKEEIIGPMSYESQIVRTRTITTVQPKEDVFSIVKQQLRGLRK